MGSPRARPQIRKFDSRIPRLVARAPSVELALEERAVLAMVDGRSTIRAVAHATGIPEQGVVEALEKLAGLGVVELLPAPPPRVTSSVPPRLEPRLGVPPPPPDAPRSSPVPMAATKATRATVPPPSAPTLAAAEPVDLTEAQQARIDAVHSRLRVSDCYEVLGVPHDAPKKAITRAYFEMAAEFHPDRFFRKRLGRHKSKIEEIFRQLSDAHDVLCSKESRARYDATLRARRARIDGVDALLEEAAAEMTGAADAARREKRSTVPPEVGVDAADEPFWSR
jgi:hypothetical protein